VNELELRASFEGNLKHSSVTHRFKRGEGIVGRVAESGEPMIFEDTRTDPRYAALSATKTKHSAKQSFFAVFPIKTKSRVFGTILFNAIAPRKLTNDEMRLLTSITEQLAVAVEKASLFRESEARSQQLTVLNKIGAAVGQSLNLDTVLNEAIEKMTESLNFDASWIYVLDPSGEELCLKAYKGLAQDVAQAIERRGCSAGVSGKIFMTGEKLVFEDYQTDKNYNDLTPSKRIRSLGFASGAGFPIKAKDRVIGVLHLANKARRHFTHDDLQLIESIAQEIGVATENARLFEQVNLKTEELGKMNQDLNEANKAKSEFISAMSHELRTPLNVIMGNAELTGDGFWGEINPEQKKSMTQIQHHSRFLLKLVNNVLALSSLDAKKISLELATVKIDELVAHAKSHVEQLNRSKTLAISWNVGTDIPDIVTDETKLEEILQNLIGNAFKFTPQGGIDVEIKNLAEQKRVEFRVADTGIGIETHDLDRIFGAFEQIKEAHTGEFNGVGLGLNIVKKYLDLMKGDIRVESRPGKGTTFTFSVPHSISMPA
jgi:signal transduction histidine kinase